MVRTRGTALVGEIAPALCTPRGESPVGQHELGGATLVGVDQDVLQLDVTVHHPSLVCERERIQQHLGEGEMLSKIYNCTKILPGYGGHVENQSPS